MGERSAGSCERSRSRRSAASSSTEGSVLEGSESGTGTRAGSRLAGAVGAAGALEEARAMKERSWGETGRSEGREREERTKRDLQPYPGAEAHPEQREREEVVVRDQETSESEPRASQVVGHFDASLSQTQSKKGLMNLHENTATTNDDWEHG
jgi:hypothetical protein